MLHPLLIIIVLQKSNSALTMYFGCHSGLRCAFLSIPFDLHPYLSLVSYAGINEVVDMLYCWRYCFVVVLFVVWLEGIGEAAACLWPRGGFESRSMAVCSAETCATITESTTTQQLWNVVHRIGEDVVAALTNNRHCDVRSPSLVSRTTRIGDVSRWMPCSVPARSFARHSLGGIGGLHSRPLNFWFVSWSAEVFSLSLLFIITMHDLTEIVRFESHRLFTSYSGFIFR